MLFGRAGLKRGPAPQLEHLRRCWLAAVGGDELAQERCLAFLDGRGALGELGHQGFGDAGHFKAESFGMAPASPVPAPAQLLGQEITEHTLVHLGEGDHGLVEAPGIERAPDAVGDRLRPVGHHHMVVELGVPGPRIPVGEGGGHHAFDVFLDHAVGTRARVEHLALGVGEHYLDGLAMAGVDLCLGVPVGQGPGHRDRLGGGEGQIESGHRSAEPAALGPLLGLDARCFLEPLGGGVIRRNGGHPQGHPLCHGQVSAVGLAAQRLAGDRVGAHAQQIEEVLLGHRRPMLDAAAVVETGQPGSQEHARWSARRCVVPGQVGGRKRRAVTRCDGLHQIAVARSQAHPA